jgi:flagellar basal-body rod protein FlgC
MDGISASVSGAQTAAQGVAVAANNIANLNTPGYQARSLDQQALPQGGVVGDAVQQSQAALSPGGSNVDLATEAVNTDTQGAGYQADLKALQVQNHMLGTALDLKA